MKEHTKNLLSIFCPLGLLLLAGLLFLGNNRPFPILSGMIEKARKEQISSERKIRQLEEGIAEKQEELNELHEIRKRAIPPHYSDVSWNFPQPCRTGLLRIRRTGENDQYTASVERLAGNRSVRDQPDCGNSDSGTGDPSWSHSTNPRHFMEKPLSASRNNVINPDYININAVLGAVCFKDGDNQSAGQKP